MIFAAADVGESCLRANRFLDDLLLDLAALALGLDEDVDEKLIRFQYRKNAFNVGAAFANATALALASATSISISSRDK